MIIRVFKCNICGIEHRDENGDGANGWGSLQGIVLDGEANPILCPEHLGRLADFTDKMKTVERNNHDVD